MSIPGFGKPQKSNMFKRGDYITANCECKCKEKTDCMGVFEFVIHYLEVSGFELLLVFFNCYLLVVLQIFLLFIFIFCLISLKELKEDIQQPCGHCPFLKFFVWCCQNLMLLTIKQGIFLTFSLQCQLIVFPHTQKNIYKIKNGHQVWNSLATRSYQWL